ncbi:hypothetical protein Q31b_29050 [Novipirellula aureliae]|uniref:Glycoamylase-like domain-containing protein n=1 Tax=Novipirellula aureliae TaxID=2527966 RepID=A0A5C6DXR7_9BACT|nr:glucoamylase family protein [Novipirellula aureliae]TWU41458.1 hypothetical protein Q31b_29050 [Novipirellula aureliae]
MKRMKIRRRTVLGSALSLPLSFSLSKASDLDDRDHQITDHERAFLIDMQRCCYQYFLEASDPTTALVSDRASTDGRSPSRQASIAACGFSLASHCVAAHHQWLPRGEIAERVRLLLRSLLEKADHHKGFLYHFLDRSTGRRMWKSEASTIDTALMIAGAMTVSTLFSDDEKIVELADALYCRVDWNWMLGSNDCMHMGWTPERGMIPNQWDRFSELIILVFLAIGAPQRPIPPRCWRAWQRESMLTFGGIEYLNYPPLFVHQYPLAFFDVREYRSPNGRDYFQNSVIAHKAHIDFLTRLGLKYPERLGHYSKDLWGLTSSDSESGYRDWGGPYQEGRIEPDRGIDGTLVPSAAAGGLPFVPEQSLRTLMLQKTRFEDAIYGRYGFVNAYNPVTHWVDPDVIGIDTGITLLMAENMMSGTVWDYFMRHPAAKRSLMLTGFKRISG